jgi:hypothetical protein
MSVQGLKGLRRTADSTVLAEIKVTPELKLKLQHRIEHAEKHGMAPGRPHRPWLRQTGYTAAAVAVVTLALVAGKAPLTTAPSQRPISQQSVPLPTPYQQQTSQGKGPEAITVTDAVGALVGPTGVNFILEASGNGVPQIATPLTAAEAQPGRKIITNGEYGLRVPDARGAVDRLQHDALAVGGYVAEATLNKEANGSWLGRVVLRVPANTVSSTIQTFGQIGIVERERQWTQDVTDQWMDLEHRIAIQQEHEKRLRELADKAATFDDWNKLATQINNTRVEIENQTGRLKFMSNQVDFAILNIQVLQLAPGEAPVSKSDTTFIGQMREAFSHSVTILGALGRQGVMGLMAMTPFVLVLLPIGVVAVLIRKRYRKERV